jgi:prepilin-type N-terminal cleavage/methylation domain-containing protein
LTLIELLVVIIIIGVFAGLAVPRLRSSLENSRFTGFNRDIYYLLRYLQAEAVAQGKATRLEVNPAEGIIQAAIEDGGSFRQIPGRFAKAYRLPQDTSVSLEPAERNFILFYPDGSVEQEVKLRFNSHRQKEVVFIIKALTGDVQVQ